MRKSSRPFGQSHSSRFFMIFAVFVFALFAHAADSSAPAVDRVMPAVVSIKATSSTDSWKHTLSDFGLDRCSATLKGNDLVFLSDGATDNAQLKKAQAAVKMAEQRLQAAKRKGSSVTKKAQREYEQSKKALAALDQTYARRAYLDFTGTPPRTKEVVLFVDDTDPQKRAKLIDSLLARPEYANLGNGRFLELDKSTSMRDAWATWRVKGGAEMSEGTGLVWRGDGHVVTTFSVVAGADKFEVTLPGGKPVAAKLVAGDALSGVAVLKVDPQALTSVDRTGPPHNGSLPDGTPVRVVPGKIAAATLAAAAIGDSAQLKPGETVFAVGNTEGFTNTVLPGIVSGLHRKLELAGQSMADLIQTNIVLPSGFAGGPLVNARGEVVGLNFAVYKPTAEGAAPQFSFALPIDEVKRVVGEIVAKGKVERAFLGVRLVDLDAAKLAVVKLSEARGAYVQDVFANSPAALAGVAAGDVILKVDGADIINRTDVPLAIRQRRPGDKVTLELLHEGKIQSLAFVATTFPDPAPTVEAKTADRLNQLAEQLVKSKRNDDQVVEALYLATLARLPAEAEKKMGRASLSLLGKEKQRSDAVEDYLFALTKTKEFTANVDVLTQRLKLHQVVVAPAELRTLSGHEGIVFAVGMSPDGRLIASGGADRTMRLWDAQSGETKFTLGHGGVVFATPFSPDGKLVACCGVGGVRYFDARTGTEVNKVSLAGAVQAAAFAPDGKTMVVGGDDKVLRALHVQSGAWLWNSEGHTGYIMTVAFSPDGKLVATGSVDKTVRVWEASTGAAVLVLAGHSQPVRAVAFSPDGKLLVSGSDDKSVRTWDAVTGTQLQLLRGHSKSLLSVAFAPAGKSIVSVDRDRAVRIWDRQTGAEQRTVPSGGEGVTAISWSPDGKILLGGASDKTVKLWRIE